MPLIDLTIKHGTTLEEAKTQLAKAVADVQKQFAAAISQTTWNADQTAVTITGPGVVVDLKVDPQNVHATGDIPLLGALLGSGIGQRISQGVKGVLTKHFPKGLPHNKT
jgi:DNA-binding protein YbaB